MYRTAASYAAELVEEAEITAPPVNIFALIKLLDIELEFCSLPENISGFYQPSLYGRPLIAINASHPMHRKRFTAAHELKHVFLDKDVNISFLSRSRVNQIEKEANSFASSLLMPEGLVNLLYDHYGYKSARILSRVFGVSFEAAVYRIYSREGYALLNSARRDDFVRSEEALYRRFQFTEIPDELGHWNSLKSAAYASNLNIHHCLHCLSVIFDGCCETCWGCGANLYDLFGLRGGTTHKTCL